jgi:hypothetical protein
VSEHSRNKHHRLFSSRYGIHFAHWQQYSTVPNALHQMALSDEGRGADLVREACIGTATHREARIKPEALEVSALWVARHSRSGGVENFSAEA